MLHFPNMLVVMSSFLLLMSLEAGLRGNIPVGIGIGVEYPNIHENFLKSRAPKTTGTDV
jgi:hypothetical protein